MFFQALSKAPPNTINYVAMLKKNQVRPHQLHPTINGKKIHKRTKLLLE